MGVITGKWIFRDTLSITGQKIFDIDFTSNGQNYIRLFADTSPSQDILLYNKTATQGNGAYIKNNQYPNGFWYLDGAFKEIIITNVSRLTEGEKNSLEYFLIANAEKPDGRKTFEVRNNDGSILYSSTSTELVRRVACNVNVDKDGHLVRRVVLTDFEYNLIWLDRLLTIDEKNNKKFVGLALKPDTIIPDFRAGESKVIEYDENTTFYEIWEEKIPEPPTEFEIDLYKNESESNRVDKTRYLSKVKTLQGTLKEEVSLISPSIKIEYETPIDFNYVYIEKFHRYYFVESAKNISHNIWEINLYVDVLMTYKDAIKSTVGFIERNADINESNQNIIDKHIVIEQGQNLEVNTIQNKLFVSYPEPEKEYFNYSFYLTGFTIRAVPSL